MITPKLFIATAVVFVLSTGASFADTTDREADKESVAPHEQIEKPGEDQSAQIEDSGALYEAYKRWSEAAISLFDAHGMESANWNTDYTTPVSEFVSILKESDSDGDGGLSIEELESAIEKDMIDMFKSLTPNERRAQLKEFHSRLDRDGDGWFTLDEVADWFNEMAEELNKDRDEFSSNQPKEQHGSDLNETEDGGRSD